MSENPRAWTVLIYFAADNDLEFAALNNKIELEELASTDSVHLLAQVDYHALHKAKHFFFRGMGEGVESDLLEEPNTGAAESLIEFVKWGSGGDHKADNYLIIIWGHGNGIDDDEDDPGAAALRSPRPRDADVAEAPAPGVAAPADETDFESVAGAAAGLPELTSAGPRAKNFEAIGDDVIPGGDAQSGANGPDAMTCVELGNALNVIEKQVLGKKIAILGMDACVMSMAEVAQQISDSAELMVASEEVIPETSWPYGRILGKLLKKPTMTPEELSTLIVDEYVAHYADAPAPVALSACRLSKTDELAEAVGDLGRALGALVRDGELRKAITRARRRTQVFRFRDYVDLHHFCEVFPETLKLDRFAGARARAEDACRRAESACERVMRVIKGEGDVPGSGFVVHSRHTSDPGEALANARGVSIYFPPIPATYADLTLSTRTRWDTFLHEYINAVFRPHALRVPTLSADHSNGLEKTDGGNIAMSADATTTKKPRLLLPKGTTVKDATGGYETELNSYAYVMLDKGAKIKVPDDTELDIPQAGKVKVKASSGTSTKATSGTRNNSLASVELVLPACTLYRPLSGLKKDLNDGTRVKTAGGEGSDPFLVLASIDFVAEA